MLRCFKASDDSKLILDVETHIRASERYTCFIDSRVSQILQAFETWSLRPLLPCTCWVD